MIRQQRSGSTVFRTSLIAGLITVGFYVVGPRLPGLADFIQRYFCSHPLEYISTAMFFTGLTILGQKYLSLRSERQMLQQASAVAESSAVVEASPERRESALAEWCQGLPESLTGTHLSSRIHETLHYLKGSRRDGLEDHLRYLAELASERLHQSFATIRTITWAIPILGFLGTVIGITMAIANVTPEQLDSSLGEVTGGLAIAFDTTALALGMSIVLVFASFAVERSEQNVLGEVEQFGIETILPWFATAESRGSSRSVQEQISGELLQQHANVWIQQLSTLSGTWSELLDRHAGQLRQALTVEVDRTLEHHRDDTSLARDTYAAALQDSASTIVERTVEIMDAFDRRVTSWQQALQASSEFSVRQSEALHELGATLLKMTESEERLVHLQQQLNDNLQALQLVETMEQTANSLTAAVHVLTAKTSTSHRTAA